MLYRSLPSGRSQASCSREGWPGSREASPSGYPWLWDPIATNFLQMPASLTGFAVGALLMWIGQKPLEPIGYLAER